MQGEEENKTEQVTERTEQVTESDFTHAGLKYQIGFGGNTEALEGALPTEQNNPQRCPFGLYAE